MSWNRHTVSLSLCECVCLSINLFLKTRRNGTRSIWILKFALLLFQLCFFAVEIGLSILFHIWCIYPTTGQIEPDIRYSISSEQKNKRESNGYRTHFGRWATDIAKRSRTPKWNIIDIDTVRLHGRIDRDASEPSMSSRQTHIHKYAYKLFINKIDDINSHPVWLV